MWTSDVTARPPRPTPALRALEVAALVLVFVFLPELFSSRLGVAREPHPGWIAVVILAARYGSSGLFSGLVAAPGAAALAWALSGTGIGVSWNRLDSGPNLLAFGACLIVSWVASCHARRYSELLARNVKLTELAAGSETTIRALRDVAEALRARVDRASASLSFMRDVATRLEGDDPVAAAEAAVDLALVRSGATAATVHAGAEGTARIVAARDAGGCDAPSTRELSGAEMILPIRAGSTRVGVLALWGLPRSSRNNATALDLAVIASWCARALVRATARPQRETVDVLEAS